ncbi:MAG: hypothetical protein AAF740_09030 [Bacteroidota bacterium]
MTLVNLTKNLVTAFALSASMMSFNASNAYASDAFGGGALRQNAEGRQACNALKLQNATYWEAKVRGRFTEGVRGGGNHFSVRNCFRTSSNCQAYINRIGNIIYPIEEIRYARCKPR